MARGIATRGDIQAKTVDGRPIDAIWDEFIETLSVYNQGRDPIAALFTAQTTESSEPVSQTSDSMEFEDVSEFGAPKSGRVEVAPLLIGYPINWRDLATRYTTAFVRDAPASQIEAQHAAALEANNRQTFKAIMRAVTTKTVLGSRPLNEFGVPIYSLWDGSADATPPAFAGKTFTAGHTHYLTSGSAAVDGLDLQVLIRTVTEHGYGINQGEQLVILVHPNESESIQALRAGSTSPYDFIPSQGAPAYLTADTIVGDRAPAEFKGLKVLGSYGQALVIESYYAVPGYVIAVAVAAGNRSPLAYRVHPTSEWQGLRIIPGTGPGPHLVNSHYEIGFGVGVRNRGAAAVMQVTTNGTYSNPVI